MVNPEHGCEVCWVSVHKDGGAPPCVTISFDDHDERRTKWPSKSLGIGYSMTEHSDLPFVRGFLVAKFLPSTRLTASISSQRPGRCPPPPPLRPQRLRNTRRAALGRPVTPVSKWAANDYCHRHTGIVCCKERRTRYR